MKDITAKELRAILATVPDDQPVYMLESYGAEVTIKSYTIHRYQNGKIELVFFPDEQCGLEND